MRFDAVRALAGGLIVSCQALPGEPLHGPHHMAAMARAAEEGGACGIRANGPDDIAAIRAVTRAPLHEHHCLRWSEAQWPPRGVLPRSGLPILAIRCRGPEQLHSGTALASACPLLTRLVRADVAIASTNRRVITWGRVMAVPTTTA